MIRYNSPSALRFSRISLQLTPKMFLNEVMWEMTNIAPNIALGLLLHGSQGFVTTYVAQHHCSHSHFTQKDKKTRFFNIKTITDYKLIPFNAACERKISSLISNTSAVLILFPYKFLCIIKQLITYFSTVRVLNECPSQNVNNSTLLFISEQHRKTPVTLTEPWNGSA